MIAIDSRSIKFKVVTLTATIVLPLLIVSALISQNLAETNRALIEMQRKNMSRELSGTIDRDFAELKGMIGGMAGSQSSYQIDNAGSPKQITKAFRLGPIQAMWKFTADGTAAEELVGISPSSGGHNLSKNLLLRVFKGEAAVSDVFGEGMKTANVIIAVPIFGQDNTVVSGLAAKVSVSYFNHAFVDNGMSKKWVAAVVDRTGHFVARSLDAETRVGTAARPELAAIARSEKTSGTFENVTLEGTPVLNSFQRSLLTAWTVVIAVPKDELEEPLQHVLIYTLFGGLSALTLSLLAATRMAAKITTPIANLSRYAHALAEGRKVEPEKYHITEIESVRTSLNQTMAKSARLAAILSSSTDAIVSVGLDGYIEEWNTEAENMFGYLKGEIVGKPNSILVPKDLLSEFDGQRSKILSGQVVRAESVRLTKVGRRIDIEFVDAPIINSFDKIVGYSTTMHDIGERKAMSEHQLLLMRELTHRTKNQLAIIQSIAQQTKRNSSTFEDFIPIFNGRIQGLAASHDILAKQQWKSIPLEELVRSQIGVLIVGADKFVDISGPNIALTAVHAESLGLALHELTTNSLKYGALSIMKGRVSVSWRFINVTEPLQVQFEWLEIGGPKIKKTPSREGFGSKVLNTITPVSLGGEAKIEHRSHGLYWTVIWEPKL